MNIGFWLNVVCKIIVMLLYHCYIYAWYMYIARCVFAAEIRLLHATQCVVVTGRIVDRPLALVGIRG